MKRSPYLIKTDAVRNGQYDRFFYNHKDYQENISAFSDQQKISGRIWTSSRRTEFAKENPERERFRWTGKGNYEEAIQHYFFYFDKGYLYETSPTRTQTLAQRNSNEMH